MILEKNALENISVLKNKPSFVKHAVASLRGIGEHLTPMVLRETRSAIKNFGTNKVES